MTNHNHNKIIHHLLPPPTIRTHSTIPACAACRYQRRKCSSDCILAPYFPHDRPRQFQNAHKLFGVSNITKTICDLDKPEKDEAMRTIIYQSDVRALDPVGGCYGIIQELKRQIGISTAELEYVLQQLAYYRTVAVQNQPQNHPQFNQDQITVLDDEVDCDIDLVNNRDDGNVDDDSSDRVHRRNSIDLNLHNIPLQEQERKDDHDQYVLGKQDLNELQDAGWENDRVAVPVQSWPSSANRFDGKPQPGQTLHASVCDEFNSLLLNEMPPGDNIDFKETNEPSDETLFRGENHKYLVERMCPTNITKKNMK